MKNLLKLGQGPRPDLLFEEEEKAKKYRHTAGWTKSRKSNLKKVFAQSEKKPKRKRVKKRKRQEPIEMSRKEQTGSYSGIL